LWTASESPDYGYATQTISLRAEGIGYAGYESVGVSKERVNVTKQLSRP